MFEYVLSRMVQLFVADFIIGKDRQIRASNELYLKKKRYFTFNVFGYFVFLWFKPNF